MNKNHIIIAVILIVLTGGCGYYVGTQAGAAQAPARGAAFAGGAGGNFAGRAGARGGAGAVFGTIIAKDSTSVTVQLGGPNGTSTNGTATGSKIVLYDNSTQIEKTVAGKPGDLGVGTNVTVAGTANSDGSITAQSIQIRPVGAGPRGQ